jgi:hypothetical protein
MRAFYSKLGIPPEVEVLPSPTLYFSFRKRREFVASDRLEKFIIIDDDCRI